MTRIAYFIFSHVNPDQVIRLIDALRSSPGAQVVVHHDYSVDYLDPNLIRPSKNVHLFPEHISVSWGTFDQVEMQLRILKWANHNLEYDWAINLTGQDYPIKPLTEIEDFLGTTEYDGFLEATPVSQLEAEDRKSCERRYFFRYVSLPKHLDLRRPPSGTEWWFDGLTTALNGKQNLLQIAPTLRNMPTRIGTRRIKTPFSEDFQCHKGSSLWSLSRRAVSHLLEFVGNHPHVSRHYARTLIPSESMLQTILSNNRTLNLCRDNLRYMRWSPLSAGPDVLSQKDFPDLIASGKHFARKIDITHAPMLVDQLDTYIGA